MATFHLRPVADHSPSPSPAASTTPPDDHHKQASMRASSARPRRPLSPSNLRDVDLTHSNDVQARKYPAPPTGHDLMAMFPPPPPDNFPEMRAGPTSGYFQRQERAFFAQAGKEIVRVRLEVDMPQSSTSARWPAPSSSAHPGSSGSHSASQSPNIPSSSAAPVLYPHPNSRPSPRNGMPSSSVPSFPLSTNHPHPHAHSGPPVNLHGGVIIHQNSTPSRTPPQDGSYDSSKGDYSPEVPDDERWKIPIPHAERRRAGKHTKRVIIRS